MTKLSSSLPKGNKNGLSHLGPALVRRPQNSHVVLAVVHCAKVTTDYEQGDVVPTARVSHIEALTADDVPRAEQLMRRAMEARMGGETLPIDLEDELAAIFKTIDVETGELLTDGEVHRSHVDDLPGDQIDDGGDGDD